MDFVENIKKATERFNNPSKYDKIIVEYGYMGATRRGGRIEFITYEDALNYIIENKDEWDSCSMKAEEKAVLWDCM